MDLFAEGRCRHSGTPGIIAAAAVTMTNKYDHRKTWVECLPDSPTPTTHRAEFHAAILALEKAELKAQQVHTPTHMDITIHTSSKYVIACMTQWCLRWIENDFKTAKGREVANRDLVETAVDLVRSVQDAGTVYWVWVPRSQNRVVRAEVKRLLDVMEPWYEEPAWDEQMF